MEDFILAKSKRCFCKAVAAAFLSTGLCLSAFPAIAAPASDASSTVFPQIQKHLREVATMTAHFVQVDRNGQALDGSLTLKKPGLIRFQYQKDVPLLVVGDGKALVMIDYSVRQVSRWPIGDSPLSILIDPSKDIASYAALTSDDGKNIVITGHDPKHPDFGTIAINFQRDKSAPAQLMLMGWTVIDAQNNRSQIILSEQKFNQPVSNNMFRWNDPRGNNGPR
ncbi:outer membrane lipoprotein carrier protein LolA [Zymomonas mobilis subsp. mobilis ZM4 = ATCC 31821]|uniref:Outer membrane lipoprotein carrier protein LolA n=1 Tax=Zymomonas mobilis subsp. mobilis (strain ATCC 31821 / ZM4 / CP4) TaxID=264203 RepID=Q5NLT5_ZYMMO|nr:outer membrane lipoprotein carrier protein LolA [Zymomonas mobilis]AAV90325.2 outer membrane lipoprotein carrier protein LolA [Zymomonas mobilis subsp. mobilis ZM4 = ATCC 31821]AVZ26520.1 outer membrane lipoprotein carrier protein LolA [Zymomonas mobilis subsp. mobilis]AVZ28406.1 outer membrane lipoprotein carrier protein LolA [Zymomonas mobilis subsp. mobilis]AVZ42852.1 outer membrane lipoprotein carrier protein LolA [Zymomonas mobilis subsp. mobilis ZM4 = ATCC 31821]UBQ07611.1 outer membr